jgi:hypothetical protein
MSRPLGLRLELFETVELDSQKPRMVRHRSMQVRAFLWPRLHQGLNVKQIIGPSQQPLDLQGVLQGGNAHGTPIYRQEIGVGPKSAEWNVVAMEEVDFTVGGIKHAKHCHDLDWERDARYKAEREQRADRVSRL